MASIFGHSLAAIALGKTFASELRKPTFWILGILCSIVPDADVIGFKFGVPYDSFWGHRGFTHSFLFAAFIGIATAYLFYNARRPALALYFTLCTASHSILDAMTSGGLGVAFFSPFENSRYFLPWRPIQVSPIGAKRFFSELGLGVLQSEAVWIGIPFLAILIITYFQKKIRR
ncbi:MAG: metal-dependent hydrolase [Bacteroidia bacterium]|jgi:inner membrane protein|tara:strand:- start:2291 stop:2812 length:522 start_codon:yes stop_codon:yes gene_type:complete